MTDVEFESNDSRTIQQWIVKWISAELDLPAKEIATDENLLNYGMDSVNAIMLVGDLENQFALRLPPTLVWDHPSVDALVKIVVSESTQIADATTSGSEQDHQPSLATIDSTGAAALLEKIDQLSDEQVDLLLNRMTQDKNQSDV